MEKEESKLEKQRNTLPDSLKYVFDLMVEDYKFAALIKHRAPYVSYSVIAEMVKAGWRRTEEPIK